MPWRAIPGYRKGAIVLHDRAGGSADNIIRTFTVNASSETAPNGTWKLEVGDDATQDVGVLNSWSLRFTLSTPEPSTTTDASGLYAFTNLSAGTYVVRQVLPQGWVQVAPGGGC